MSHFLGWGAGRGQGDVGVGGGWGGGGVSICLKRGHIFWCRTFWSGEWGCGGGSDEGRGCVGVGGGSVVWGGGAGQGGLDVL